ncbi:hypothetical protein LINGRAHAP2_LOCUS6252 [Linum grandiflorum]
MLYITYTKYVDQYLSLYMFGVQIPSHCK